MTENIYTSGKYLEATPTWHAEDSPWKARQIKRMIDRNQLRPATIAEIGCGSASILDQLSGLPELHDVSFEGYDISPQAIEMATKLENERLRVYQEDLVSEDNEKHFDILLVIDVSSVLRNAVIGGRYTIGHIHYFMADSALGTLRDTGHEIVDCFYTSGGLGLFKEHPTFKKAVANVPRWLLSKVSLPLTARLLGGYSLLVLAK